MNDNYNWMNLLNAESYIVIYHYNITTYADNGKHVNKYDLYITLYWKIPEKYYSTDDKNDV